MFEWIDGNYTKSKATDFAQDNVLSFWRYEKARRPRDKLPTLALTVLAIAVNTATCERLFSELALIHTARRNRMNAAKSMKIQVVRQHVLNKNEEVQMAKPGGKFITRTIVPTERPTVSSPPQSRLATSFASVSQRDEHTPSFDSFTPSRLSGAQSNHHHPSNSSFSTPCHQGNQDIRGTPLNLSPKNQLEDSRVPATGTVHDVTPRRRLAAISPNVDGYYTTLLRGAGSVVEQQTTGVEGNLMNSALFSGSQRHRHSNLGDHVGFCSSTPQDNHSPVARDLSSEFAMSGDADDSEDNDDYTGDERSVVVWENILDEYELGENNYGKIVAGIDTGNEEANDSQRSDVDGRAINEADNHTRPGFDSYLEEILIPDPSPFPPENAKKMPQENKLTGIRARKVELKKLFGPVQPDGTV